MNTIFDESSCGCPPLHTHTDDIQCLFVGDSGSGKSSLIQQFLAKDESLKPTVALEYRKLFHAASLP